MFVISENLSARCIHFHVRCVSSRNSISVFAIAKVIHSRNEIKDFHATIVRQKRLHNKKNTIARAHVYNIIGRNPPYFPPQGRDL